jgi:phosphoribosylformylglycinamidine (FGAM) synthase-like enzyme/phosphoribosylformylglycinamidine (FGAM) synthase-like amidotransferase family enzyme
MKIGVIRYPGSNCFYDTMRYFNDHDCIEIWHKKDTLDENIDLLIIPGGFAFGDRYYENATGEYTYNPGQMCVEAPVSKIIFNIHKKCIPILGICNGFQILIKLGLLSGKLIENRQKRFTSQLVKCNYNFKDYIGKTEMYIANYYGNYQNNTIYFKKKHLQTVNDNNNIFLTYEDFSNGSVDNIAGIYNDERNVFGMMPHPERNSNFKNELLKILTHNYTYINHKIERLLNSEHISYKSTKQFLRGLYCKGEHVVQGPGENAGIVDIGKGYCISIRIESHNHPTFKNAFEGAATGVGGIIRDIICMGSKPIALLDFLRFGTDKNSNELLEEAVKGIAYYGNTIGIPNVGGSLHRHSIYDKNPLVNVACIGIVKRDNIIYGNALNKNSVLILCGAKTGDEGVDSAVMASKQSTNERELKSQKADAYLENLLLDAFVEISETGLAEGCQDLGAGGILCATTEVIKRGREKTDLDLGCDIYLNNVSLKCELDNYSILASESQERMLIVCKPENCSEIYDILNKWNLEHDEIGIVTENGLYNVYNNESIVYSNKFINFKETDNNLKNTSNKDIYSIEKINRPDLWTGYDHTIGCRTIKGPDKPGQYSILDIHEINKKLIITWSTNVDNCYNKMLELNGTPLGIVNCLNFGDPKSCIGDFKNAVEYMNERCIYLKIPVLGGNVSMYNSTNNKDISPSIVIVMIGLMNN